MGFFGGQRFAFWFHGTLCAYSLRQASLEIEVVRILESIVELLGALSFCALTALIATCILGSMVAALRAVSRGSAPLSAKK
jgi:hypothetical protein